MRQYLLSDTLWVLLQVSARHVRNPNSSKSSAGLEKQPLDAKAVTKSQQVSTPVLQAKLASIRLEKSLLNSKLAESLEIQQKYSQQVQDLKQQLLQIKQSAQCKVSQVGGLRLLHTYYLVHHCKP